MKKTYVFLSGFILFFLTTPTHHSLAKSYRVLAPPDSISKACTGDNFRAFDYWLGEWTVRSSKGDVIGHSKISRVSDGCAILEEWSATRGSTGRSLNFYDADRGQWRQTWVGGSGMILDLAGNLEDGNMTLYGKKETPKGIIKHRIRWMLMDDGRVEQRWDTSTDAGKTWKQVFTGLYKPTN